MISGVPYAQPPVGDLRFKRPKPAQSWSGVRDALSPGSVCPQKDLYSGETSLNVLAITALTKTLK